MLSQTGQYALQAMVHLAEHAGEQPIAGPLMAKRLRVPPKYLSRVLADLVRQGLLTATPGKSGGFRLARSPENIMLIEVVAHFEPYFLSHGIPCPFGNLVCDEENPCAGHDRWKKVKESYLSFLNETSVQDVSHKGTKEPSRAAVDSTGINLVS